MASKRNIQKQQQRQAGIALIDSWRADWNRFVRDALEVRLDREQQEILSSVQCNPRTSVVSGTARGKDFVAACAAMSFMYLTPRWNTDRQLVENTKVALTAPTDRQVKNIMIPEISRLFNRAKQKGIELPGRLNSSDIRTSSSEWFLTGFKADEHNHEAWSGFHAVHTMFVITEATGINDDTFSAIEGNLQGDSRILIVFNPNSTTGYAARSQRGDRWAKFRLNSLTAPNVIHHKNILSGQVDYDWVVDKLTEWCTQISPQEASAELDDFEFEGKWYRPEDLFRKKVLGKFPKVADDVLIPQQWLDLAHERWEQFGRREYLSSDIRMLGVDVAGMGRDSSCFVERQGDYCSPFEMFNSGGSAEHMQVVGKIIERRKFHPSMIASIDTIGEGAGVYSRCKEEIDGKYIISCKFSEGAKQNDKYLRDITGQYEFINMRAYLAWCVRDWLNPKYNTGAMLPRDDKFDEECTEIRYSFRSDGRIYIEPKEEIKKRLGRSPDKFDALCNTFYPVMARKRIDVSRIARRV